MLHWNEPAQLEIAKTDGQGQAIHELCCFALTRSHHAVSDDALDLNEALSMLLDLLEDYSPSWYTAEHHARVEAALLRDSFANDERTRCRTGIERKRATHDRALPERD